MKVALAQINPTVGDLEGNTTKIIGLVEEARSLGADLVAFPELAITGYPPEDLLFKPSFLQANMDAMHSVVAASRDIAVVVGFAEAGSDIYNAAARAFQSNLETDGSAFCLAVQPLPCSPLKSICHEIVAGAVEGSFASWHELLYAFRARHL